MENTVEVLKNNNLTLDTSFLKKWGDNEFKIMDSLLFKFNELLREDEKSFNLMIEKEQFDFIYEDFAKTMNIPLTKNYIQDIIKSMEIISNTGFYIAIDGGRSYTRFVYEFDDLEEYKKNDQRRFLKIKLNTELWQAMLGLEITITTPTNIPMI